MNFKFIVLICLLSACVLSKCCLKLSKQDHKNWDLDRKERHELPKSFDWGNVDGKNYLTQRRNQHIPKYCGGCWIFGALSHLNDRFSVARNAAFPEIILSPQVLLDHDYYDNGCHGGDAFMAMKWIKENGVEEEACSQYRAQGHELSDANTQPVCKDCTEKTCFVPQKYNTFTISHYGALPPGDVEAIMTEIYARGPVFCAVDAVPLETDIPFGFTGVLKTERKADTDHVIEVTGWGVDENGVEYWNVKNSWGEYFGNNGNVKVERGNNTLWIEEFCGYGVPKKTWEDMKLPTDGSEEEGELEQLDEELDEKTEQSNRLLVSNEEKKISQEQMEEIEAAVEKKIEEKLVKDNQINLRKSLVNHLAEVQVAPATQRGGTHKSDWKHTPPRVTNPLPRNYIPTSELPERFWWGNVKGVNYLTWVLNQHIPQYCGSCYAFSALNALSDRINISTKNLNRVNLSVQNILNCGVGSCEEGGSHADVYEFAHTHGVTEYGCFNYQAKSPAKGERNCTEMDTCINCWGTADKYTCWSPKQHPIWYAKEFGFVSGHVDMKKEIFARGPIACLLKASDRFYYGYQGGVWREETTGDQENHGIVVTGWGQSEEEGEYWIVRNSWGTYWGENGYFRVPVNDAQYNLGIEEMCTWAVPKHGIKNPGIVSWINKP